MRLFWIILVSNYYYLSYVCHSEHVNMDFQYIIVAYFLYFECINSSSNEIFLNKRGQYQNILIVIEENVPENVQLLTKIKEKFSRASKVLAKATYISGRGSLSFGSVDVLVPFSWSNKNRQYKESINQTYDYADIRIQRSFGINSNQPTTLQHSGCGKQGLYTRYTDEYILDDSESDHHSKTIVHEWSHYRWGVFEESPVGGYPHFYVNDGKLYPTRCTFNVKGSIYNIEANKKCSVNKETNLPYDGCKFIPDMKSTTTKASLMNYINLNSVVNFCSNSSNPDYKHNSYSNNLHNDMCQGRSVWSVMQDHDDFKKTNISVSKYVEPIFKFYQISKVVEINVVLLISISRAVFMQSFIHKFIEAVKIYILCIMDPSMKLGIVTFDYKTQVLESLKIPNKHNYINKLNGIVAATSRDKDGSLLTDALLHGFRSLGRQFDSPKKYNGSGHIILMSDEQDVHSTSSNLRKFDKMIATYGNSTVTVNAISVNCIKDSVIRKLVTTTRGHYYCLTSNSPSTDLMLTMLDIHKNKFIIIGNGVLMHLNEYQNIAVFDSSIGKSITFVFTFTDNAKLHQLAVKSPSNMIYTYLTHQSIFKFDKTNKIITLEIENTKDVGIWQAHLTAESRNLKAHTVNYLVFTKAKVKGAFFINVNGGFEPSNIKSPEYKSRIKVYVSVFSQSRPVLDATVQLIINPPVGAPRNLQMLDIGSGSDSIANDGIYTTSLIGTDILKKGIYRLTAQVTIFQSQHSNEEIFRFIYLGTLEVENDNDIDNINEDNFAPDRIRNVQVKTLDIRRRRVQLDWIAVGNDGDRGKAATYEIVAKNYNKKNVQVDVDIAFVKHLPQPGIPGEKETAIFQITGNMSEVHLLIRATDSVPNSGEWSRPVTVTFKTPIFGVPHFQSSSTWWVIGIVVLIVVIVFVAGVLLIKFGPHRSDRRSDN